MNKPSKSLDNWVIGICLIICLGLIAYDQYDNYRFRVEWQAMCDREGC
jgi:uncharacterized membrane protein YebE (DUF533 family)